MYFSLKMPDFFFPVIYFLILFFYVVIEKFKIFHYLNEYAVIFCFVSHSFPFVSPFPSFSSLKDR